MFGALWRVLLLTQTSLSSSLPLRLSFLSFLFVFPHQLKPAFVFDGRNILDHDALRAIGFEVHAIGKAWNVPLV